MSTKSDSIIYTMTDEAPALATRSLLPILKAFGAKAGVRFDIKDISLAGRILAHFPENLKESQRCPDALAELGQMAKTPAANIVKLPNISASIPQLKAAITELQSLGYDVPDYPEQEGSDAEKGAKATYAKVLGSAVNPVLREGNSDRRVAPPVKTYAKTHPHSMGAWSKDSKSHVAHMDAGDFYASEKSAVCDAAGSVRIELVGADGKTQVLKDAVAVEKADVIDAAVMSRDALRSFFAKEMDAAQAEGVLLSLHLKATMMKVSDPIIFGHAVELFFQDVFVKHAQTLSSIGVSPNLGVADLVGRLEQLPQDKKAEIEADIKTCYEKRPELAMVDSDRGITNLHVSSDVIIDASMPAAIRTSGQMWGRDGKLHDTKAMIPDRSYALIYQEVISYCKENGAFDPSKMGSVANVGLMAKKAEEYGSHDKTFEIPSDGTVRVVSDSGKVIFEHTVASGDIWRMCQTKDVAIRDWVKLAVRRSRASGSPAIFWLDPERGHDSQLIAKVEQYLANEDTIGLEVKLLSPTAAMRYSLARISQGQDTISVTGNVLRDYLTDLFPILELGTSAKMLSIVPLLNGGGLYETGAGGSAPKHVQQFVQENHLRWDSLGEFLALAVSLEELGEKTSNSKATVLGDSLNKGIEKFLQENKSPSRKAGELDNRGSHFYLSLFWAQALAECKDSGLSTVFSQVAKDLAAKEQLIVQELNQVQGKPVDMGGYYMPDEEKVSRAMRPSATFNAIIDGLAG